MILYKCWKCGADMSSPDRLVGKQDICPKCRTISIIPNIVNGVQERPTEGTPLVESVRSAITETIKSAQHVRFEWGIHYRRLAIVILTVGILLLGWGLMMDTSVEVSYPDAVRGFGFALPHRVNNLGLMQERQNLMILGGIFFVGGIVLLAVTAKPHNK
jgi:hypothetical protein